MEANNSERALTWSTLKVYLFLLKKGADAAGSREVMRALGFSSPSTAMYHLEKLRRLGLVEKDKLGLYHVVKRVRINPLEAFLFFRGHVIPRHGVYASILSIFLVIYWLLFSNLLTLINFIALLPAIIACIILWYETILIWKMKSRLE